MANRPKDNEEKIDGILDAWSNLAPTKSFGGMTLDEFRALVAPMKTTRQQIASLEDQLTAAIAARDSADATALEKAQRVVSGVLADPTEGPNSPVYEAMGYTRKADRKSGLTRKKDAAPKPGAPKT